ncbi:hypothetical protein MXB_1506 [Myxobolus squamalis]|nr:hypothetical protein MXB_1506 [Myxobolus squamalis]
MESNSDFNETDILSKLKDEDFDDDPDLSAEVDAEVCYNVQSKQPVLEDYTKCILIIENLPGVPLSKISKLQAELFSIFSKLKVSIRDIRLPILDEKSKGFCLVMLESQEDTIKLRGALTNYPYLIARKLNFGTVYIYSTDPLKLKSTFERFSPFKVQWSQNGSFLVGFNERGIMLITASTPQKTSRKFYHSGVLHCDFSPCERYMLTYSCTSTENSQKMFLSIWDVDFNSAPIKTFSGVIKPFTVFKWSFDGSYLSYVSDDSLLIYDLNTKSLVAGTPMRIQSIQSVFWSPVSNELVYWEKGVTESPSQIVLLSVPSFEKKVLRQIFNMEKCSIVWNYLGTSLSLAQTRYVKKTIHHSLEIVYIKLKDSSVETIELKNPVSDFVWEPYGSLCALVSTRTVMILRSDNQTTTTIKTIENCNFQEALWCPLGQILILASNRGDIMFEVWSFDGKNISLLGRGQHADANYIAWSSTGKFFVTSSHGPNASGNKFIIWSCAGYILVSHSIQSLSYCLWRPRSKNFSTSTDIQNIWTDIEKYTRQYSEEIKSLKQTHHKFVDTAKVDVNWLAPSTTAQIERIKKISNYCKRYRGIIDGEHYSSIAARNYPIKARL